VGCVSPGPVAKKESEPPKGVPCQVVATWNHQVTFTADPAHNGVLAPGLSGRLYLFGRQVSFPMTSDGSLVVELYDETPPTVVATGGPPPQPRVGPDGQPLPLEVWRFDKDTLKRLLQRDVIGWGYTLFLPWGTYRPDIGQVRLKVRYEPPVGTALYSESTPLALMNPAPSGTASPVTAMQSTPQQASPVRQTSGVVAH
jgi:hypothetical protein